MKYAKNDQRGIVAIIVTMILMIVLSIIILSFAKISQRAEQDAASRQLSTQAFYAAESGVNQARKVLNGWVATNDLKLKATYTDTCGHFASSPIANIPLPGSVGASTGNSSYTCLFVNPTPPQFEFTKTDGQIVFPFNPIDGSGSLALYWDDDTGNTNFSGCPTSGNNFPTSSCNASVLRVEVTSSSLATSDVFFIYPTNGGSPASLPYGAPTGSTSNTQCTAGGTPRKCSATITGIAPGSFVRVKGVYAAIALTAQATSGSNLVGGQAIIDATGKAADTERRIQVRVSIDGVPHDLPPYLVQGMDNVCKEFYIDGSSATDEGGCWGGSTNTPN